MSGQTRATRKAKNARVIIDSSDEDEVEVKKPAPKRKRAIGKKELEDPIDTPKKKVKAEPFEPHPWQDAELLTEWHNVDLNVTSNIIKLLDDKNTIPFIARYRKNEVGNLAPEVLRDIKEDYEKIQAMKARAQAIIKVVEKKGQLSVELKKSILSARNSETLEHLYAPFKTGTLKLADRAKALGLEEPALLVMQNQKVSLEHYVQNKDGLKDVKAVEKGVMHIIAQVIACDVEVLEFLRKLKRETACKLMTSKAQQRNTKTSKVDDKKLAKEVDESKFSNYFDYTIPVKYVKPHQVLAINRGENLKILSVKIDVPDYLFEKFKHFCLRKWDSSASNHWNILTESIKDAYARLVLPLVKREIRADLKALAEKASIEVFNGNLKQLLLAAPLKGRCVLGIDPGFSHGCKVALVSTTGELLETTVVYPHKTNSRPQDEMRLKDLLVNNNCTLIAIGNGTACRETESWISDLISRDAFKPLDVSYTIVSENGASIYSCSAEAKKEFPKLDPNLISAASLARRIQEPLAELVKIEPKHLGVGMYQHDLPQKRLDETLDEVISECVSFVGVDLNTASQCLLRRIAGLTDKRATEIIKYRQENGCFKSRDELKKVKGIGAHTFKQCAGFLKILDPKSTNKLDYTIVHPESYHIAKAVIKSLDLNVNDIGESNFINKVLMKQQDFLNRHDEFDTSKENMYLILDAISKPLDHDFRSEFDIKPLFLKGLTNINDLVIGAALTGRVENVTHFGCFVDVGVGSCGLIHTSKMRGVDLQIGDHVEVRVLTKEVERKRIGLELIKKL